MSCHTFLNRTYSCVRNLFSYQRAAMTVLLTALLSFNALSQTPNTASMIVTVVDQNDAVISGANVTIENTATGDVRNAASDSKGSATIAALSLTGEYKVSVAMTGFAAGEVSGLTLRAGEIATVKVKLLAAGGQNEVTVFGTTEGVRDNPQLGLPLKSEQIDETPILGRKITTVPLLNAAFRQGKGTGDLFVNATYFITGVGSRRATTFVVDGASDDEAWGRQTMIATLPIGAVQEMSVLTNAFSSEFGWTSGPAINIVTKSGTNRFHGEGLVLFRPGGWQADSFSTKYYCPSSAIACTPGPIESISPVDIPDKLNQYSGSIGGPIVKDRTFFFVTAEHTRQNRTTYLSPNLLPAFLLPADGRLDWTGHYRQTLVDARIDHSLNENQNLMFRFNSDRFFDDNPQDAVGGNNAPSVARKYSRRSWTTQANHTWVINHALVNEARFAFLNGDPVTLWEAQNPSTTYTRGGTEAFTIGQSRESDLFSRQIQIADTMSWTHGRHYLRFGGSIVRHRSGGRGNEPGAPTLGTFTFVSTGTLPFDQLTLADVQSYSQPINFGVDSYILKQWLVSGFVQDSFRVTPDLNLELGLRYDRQTITDAKKDFAPRIGFGWHPGGSERTSIRGGYGMYYTQVRTNSYANFLFNGLDGLGTYTATPGQVGFPTCLTCAPVNVDPLTLPPGQLPPRDIVIRAGQRDFYRQQFAENGLDFDLLPNYPDHINNPRSQVFSIGVEREVFKGFFASGDYVRQHLSNIDRTVDLNAPSPFDRTALGQCRAASCSNTANVAAANLTRPILPEPGGIRQVNVLMNLGVADYNALQTQFSYRGHSRFYFSGSYTLSKATNTTEPDGNGINPNDSSFARLGEEERGPSVVDQRHRAVIFLSYRFPWNFTAGTLSQFASARPFNATTGIDNNGDGANNDRPFINGRVIPKSSFRGTPTSDVSLFVENRIGLSERTALVLRFEGFNIFNHANILGRSQTVYSTVAFQNGQPVETLRTNFGALTTTFFDEAGTIALPAFANIDPPRMFQVQARFIF